MTTHTHITASTADEHVRDLLAAALSAAERGWHVFPLRPRVMWSVKLSHPSECRTVAVAAMLVSTAGVSVGRAEVSSPRRGAWASCLAAVVRLGLGRSW
jgi:hypothetical protein